MAKASGLPGAGALVHGLIALAAFIKELETQSHLIHLNYEAANFLPVHEFLKGQYEMHLEQFDTVAEFVRAQDCLMPMRHSDLRAAGESCCFQEVESYDARRMLMTYFGNLDILAEHARTLEPVAQEAGAIDVANSMADLVAQSAKASWFIKATLRGMV